MTESPVIAAYRIGLVVCVHLFTDIPVVAIGTVAILLYPAIAKMVLSPPLLVPVCCAVHTPGLTLSTAHRSHQRDREEPITEHLQ